MDSLTEKKLNDILEKEVLALTDGEIQFLKARSSYLTAIQKEVYTSVLTREPVVVKVPNLNKSRSYRAMQTQARELGLPFIGQTRENLERSLDTAIGPK